MKKLIVSLIVVTLLAGMWATQALAQEPPACEAEYTVQPGDWLSEVAKKYYGDPLAYSLIITASNAQSDDAYPNIATPDSVEPGTKLCLPPAAGMSPLPQTENAGSAPQLVGPIWQWQQTQMNNGDLFTPNTPANYTIQFMADGTAAIQADCNTVRAVYTVEENRVSLTMGPSTLMACPEGSLGDQFVSNLSNTTLFFFQEGNLFIDLKFDSGTMSFSPISSQLPGSNWIVTNYNNGREAVVGLLTGTELTADFGEDGTLSGSAGCNRYSAGYEVDSNNISIGMAVSTQMACSEPEGVMEQEQEYLAALSTAATYQVMGNTMQMRTADDALAAMFTRAAATPTLADEVMNKISLVQHNFDPQTNQTTFTCASSGQGLKGVATDPAGARFVGPNAGDFDLWGAVGLFQVNPDGSMELVTQQTGGKFVSPDGFEFTRITLDRTLAYFASGQAIWTGDYGQPGRIEKCDPTIQ